ncbi:MAG TPA: 50S ribosomal protein L3, partial [Planctomycetaceae bacterium]|nr:50S ribosomal protein L3 [Planctomycetaceae bacterium]
NINGRRQKQRTGKGLEPIPKANCEPKRFVREFRTDGETHDFEIGKIVNVSLLTEVPRVDLIGQTKGRGFTGVMKGKRMGGRYGNEQVTMRNIRVVRLVEAENMVLVEGAVPGPNGGWVMIRPTKKHAKSHKKA